MNRKYLLRKNFKSVYRQANYSLLGHIAFKTRDALWLDTSHPALVLISVDSAMHTGAEGHLKMEALISIIRSSVKGPLTVLIADTAHLQTRRLVEDKAAFSNSLQAADELICRFSSHFTGCNLLYWHQLSQEPSYWSLKAEIKMLVQTDHEFQTLLFEDAEGTWTEERRCFYPDRNRFIEAAIEDLMEQSVCLQLLARRNYRYLFYPGEPYESTLYLDKLTSSRLKWINVFLSIEKKKETHIADSIEPIFD